MHAQPFLIVSADKTAEDGGQDKKTQRFSATSSVDNEDGRLGDQVAVIAQVHYNPSNQATKQNKAPVKGRQWESQTLLLCGSQQDDCSWQVPDHL